MGDLAIPAAQTQVQAAASEALWTDWDRPPRTPAIPVVHVDGFDGPMDLLLDLAERQRLDLGRVSVLQLVEQFVAAMAQLVAIVPLNQRADWLVMATRLVQLRAQILLTTSAADAAEADATVAAEEEQLEERLRMRAAAAWLDRQPQLGRDVFARPAPARLPRESPWLALLEGVLLVLDGPRPPPVLPERYRPVLFRGWPAAAARARILDLLPRADDAPLSLLHCLPEDTASDRPHHAPALPPERPERPGRRRVLLGSLFSAALELAREGALVLEQDDVVPVMQRAPEPSGSA
jgi:segregation and condensation protein A